MRYVHLFLIQLRASFLLSMQYRSDFFLDAFIELFWAATTLVPLTVVYRGRETIAGWSYGEALFVTGWFTVLQGVLEGAINPSLANVVEQIRKGTLDFVLLKPADAQFLVSTSRFAPFRAINLVTATCIFAYGSHLLGHAPTVSGVLLSIALFACAVVVLYALWIITTSAAFEFVKVDNLSFLVTSVLDAGRWPIAVFRGTLRAVFTYVIPIALMTTFPAEAMLGRLAPGTLAKAAAIALALAVVGRMMWSRALAKYTSASS